MSAGMKAQQTVEHWALQHEMIPEQLDPLAETIRDLYIRHRRSGFPNYYLNSTKYNATFWRLVATKVKDCKADPTTYVSTAFRQCGAKTYPEALLSVQFSNSYRTDCIISREAEDVERWLKLFAINLKAHYAYNRQPLADLLVNKQICGCPLFVWCMSVKYGLTDLAARYKADADRLLLNPAYKQVYSKAFKEVFDGVSR